MANTFTAVSGNTPLLQNSTSGTPTLSANSATAVNGLTSRWSAHAPIRHAANGGGTAGANFTFTQQWQALGTYYGYRLIYANYGTSALTLDLSKAAGVPTDLHTGVGATFVSGPSGLSIPTGFNINAGAGKDFVPGLAMSDLIIQSSVARTDFPSENPLLQTRSYFSGAGTMGQINNTANAELFTTYGWRFAANTNSGDQVTTITAQTPSRAGNWLQPVGVDFYYDKPAVSIVDCQDSLFRGRVTNVDTEGFSALAHRVCAIKRASNSNKIWSPSTFSVSGQLYKASSLTAKQIASVMKPDYLLVRDWSVNTTNNQANVDESWALLVDLVETCRRNGVQIIIGTTGMSTGNIEPALGRIRAQNARLLTLRNAGAIVVDIVSIAYDPATGLPLAGATADGTHLTETYAQLVAAAFAAAIPD